MVIIVPRMTSPILIRQIAINSQWTEPEKLKYDSEEHLQTILVNNPTLIPGVPEGSVAVSELPTNAGPADICVIGPDGSLTIVECKLAKTSEHRRTIIGQVIDYSSAIRSAGPDSFRAAWSSRGGENLDNILDPEKISLLEGCISKGDMNLCLAVDRIDDDIRRLIEYLNLITKNTIAVTALELAYAKQGDFEVLVSSTYGQEIANSKSTGMTTSGESWTWETFLAALNEPSDKELVDRIREKAEATTPRGHHERFWFGRRPGGGINVHAVCGRYAAFQLWINSAGRLIVYGNWRTWQAIRNDSRFSSLASLLGQDMDEGYSGVLLSTLDFETFWKTALDCDRSINEN